MQNISNLSLQTANWFFVGENDNVDGENRVSIKSPFIVGRDPNSDLYLECGSVSGSHAQIVTDNDEIWLEDLNSTNGTFVNGKRVTEKCQLNRDDTIQFGTAMFQIGNAEGETENARTAKASDDFEKLLMGNGVVPFFQPIVRLTDDCKEILGYELLGRSHLLGMRTPEQMFAVASQLEKECELSLELRKRGIKIADEFLPKEFGLFVNTHPSEIESEGLIKSLSEIRNDHPDRSITIEVHESVLNKPEPFRKLLAALENMDIQLAIHAFGSGQVSMATLSEVIPAIVKFDMNLIRGIESASPSRRRFVSALVEMMRDLGVVPMAEFVEEESEAKVILELGFALGQGFYYGRPTSIADCQGSTAEESGEVSDEVEQTGNSVSMVAANSDESSPVEEDAEPMGVDWLNDQPGHFYTMQVMSAISEEKAREFVATQTDQGKFIIYPKQGSSRTLYIVAFGVFEDRSSAKVASERFSDGSITPWIKLISAAQSEVSN